MIINNIRRTKVNASQLFKRLSSYAKDHPLYKATKEFGRIIKSIFILTYFEDVKVRSREHVRDDAGHSSSTITDRYIDIELTARARSAKRKVLDGSK